MQYKIIVSLNGAIFIPNKSEYVYGYKKTIARATELKRHYTRELRSGSALFSSGLVVVECIDVPTIVYSQVISIGRRIPN